MKLDLGKMNIIFNILFSFFLVVCAILQSIVLYKQNQGNLFIKKTEHFIKFNQLWSKFLSYIEYVENYKARFIVPNDYKEIIDLTSKLEEHKYYTSCYFSKKLQDYENNLFNQIIAICPASNVDASIISGKEVQKRCANIFDMYKLLEKQYIRELR